HGGLFRGGNGQTQRLGDVRRGDQSRRRLPGLGHGPVTCLPSGRNGHAEREGHREQSTFSRTGYVGPTVSTAALRTSFNHRRAVSSSNAGCSRTVAPVLALGLPTYNNRAPPVCPLWPEKAPSRVASW